MAMRYLKDSESFNFPSSWGFSGSSTGRDDAKDQPLTPEQQGLEFGLKGNFDGGDDGTYVSKLARGGQPKRLPMARTAAPRRPKLPQAPGPSPTPAMSPMAQALATPGSPMNAPGAATAMAGQPPAQPDGMARGGRMRKARGGEVCYADGGMAKGGNFIQGAIKHPGALHRQLGVPEGQKIPASKLEAATHSKNPTLRRRANFAETLKGLSHKRG